MEGINEKAVVRILSKSASSKAFAKYILSRDRDIRGDKSKVSTLRIQMSKQGHRTNQQEIIDMLNELEKEGFVKKEKGEEFRWKVPAPVKTIRDIYEKSKPEQPEAEERTFTRSSITRAMVEETAPRAATGSKTFVFPLGPGREVQLAFKGTITKQDMEFITDRLLQEVD